MSRIKVSYGIDDLSVYFIQQTSLNWIHLLESFMEIYEAILEVTSARLLVFYNAMILFLLIECWFIVFKSFSPAFIDVRFSFL